VIVIVSGTYSMERHRIRPPPISALRIRKPQVGMRRQHAEYRRPRDVPRYCGGGGCGPSRQVASGFGDSYGRVTFRQPADLVGCVYSWLWLRSPQRQGASSTAEGKQSLKQRSRVRWTTMLGVQAAVSAA